MIMPFKKPTTEEKNEEDVYNLTADSLRMQSRWMYRKCVRVCVYTWGDLFVFIRRILLCRNLQLNFSRIPAQETPFKSIQITAGGRKSSLLAAFFYFAGWCIMEGHLKCNKRKKERTKQISRCSFDS